MLIYVATGDVHKTLGSVTEQDVLGIKDVAQRWTDEKSSLPYLIVRVLHGARLLHFAKPHKVDKWPFQVT